MPDSQRVLGALVELDRLARSCQSILVKRQWQLQDAKNRFSELVERAVREGPQTVTRRGEPVVMVVSFGDYRKRTRPRKSVAELLRACPVAAEELDLTRAGDLAREVDL